MRPNSIIVLILMSITILITLILNDSSTINKTSKISAKKSIDSINKILETPLIINTEQKFYHVDNYIIESKTNETSKFNQRCLDKLNIEINNSNYENISINHQLKITILLKNCIYKIDMELALTERSITRNSTNQPCFNKIYEIRDSLLELGTDAQFFSDLPNNNDADRVNIATVFKRISDNIIKGGENAMHNRTNLCMS